MNEDTGTKSSDSHVLPWQTITVKKKKNQLHLKYPWWNSKNLDPYIFDMSLFCVTNKELSYMSSELN